MPVCGPETAITDSFLLLTALLHHTCNRLFLLGSCDGIDDNDKVVTIFITIMNYKLTSVLEYLIVFTSIESFTETACFLFSFLPPDTPPPLPPLIVPIRP